MLGLAETTNRIAPEPVLRDDYRDLDRIARNPLQEWNSTVPVVICVDMDTD